MKLGFLTACLPALGLEDLLNWSSDNGFQTMEIAAWPLDSNRDYSARQLDAAVFDQNDSDWIQELLEKYGIKISALAYYENNMHPDLTVRNGYHQHLKKVIRMASLLGVGLVGTFVGARPDKSPDENISEIGEVFRELVKFAADQNVKLMIENCPMENWVKFGFPGNYAYSPELWENLFNEVPADNFGLNLDPSHLHWLGIDIDSVIHNFASKLFHVHAKDTEIIIPQRNYYGILNRQLKPIPWQSGWWRYRIPGLGEINWKQVIGSLKQQGYDFVLSIEHEDPVWEGSEEKVKKGLKLGLEHLSQCLNG